MSRIIEMLIEKNEVLEKFYGLNQDELAHFSEGDFDNIENFYQSRDCMLKIIENIDKKIEEENTGYLTPEELNDHEKSVVLKELDKKNNLVQLILSQDLQILSRIEEEKSQIIRELKQTQVTTKAIGSYKSPVDEVKQIDETA